ncbi:putative pterin-binding protein [Siccirubricoccus phaeus]|uniref:molybdopterin-dependent oxidoreductase n=1 Tax=Siccirubricoccus phaeus TaxID=2595053 RepID=UPI001A9C96BA|nr:molybdopterin-dependent oxidoreductase [Siccirubricoccus phaeus]
MDRQGRRWMLALAAGAACAPALAPSRPAHAQGDGARQPLPAPGQRPVLTISGKIRHTNQGEEAVFDRPMLEAFGFATIVTNSPWFDGPMRFDGVPMVKLMEAVGASGETVTAIALNDYSTDIPITDFARFNVILALLRNGQPMRVSDKGPLFIVYPYDSSPELRSRLYYSRSAWSVARLVVR